MIYLLLTCMRYADCTAQASTRPFIVSVQRVNFPYTQSSCVFSAHAHRITHTWRANAYTPLFSLLVVSSTCLGPQGEWGQVLHCQISELYLSFHLCQHAYCAVVWNAGQHIRDTSAK
jgi:hypothetical protein